MNNKDFSADAIIALKEALVHVYWRRKNLKDFLKITMKNTAIIATIDFDNCTKRESVVELIDRLLKRKDLYNDDILALFEAINNFKGYSHLKQWDDSEKKIEKAKNAVSAVRKCCSKFFNEETEKKRAIFREEQQEKRIEGEKRRKKLLLGIKKEFNEVFNENDSQIRGYKFEKFLKELFDFYDLDYKNSFRIKGEQIDGAFTFDSSDYLVEAKWQTELVNRSSLLSFQGKIEDKNKLTLGLFISFNGFSKNVVDNSDNYRSLILVDGNDLYAILEDRITLPNMIYRKRRHAAETGKSYFSVNDMFC